MADIKAQYIPNPLVPQNPEGKDLYLVTELNKIAQWIANYRADDESGTDPTDPPPIPGHQHWHDNLINVLPDQHHAQMHAHDGIDGSGPVDYNDLINKPAPGGPGDKNVDGGFAEDVYLPSQSVDGGFA
jgi:hypothetical protein